MSHWFFSEKKQGQANTEKGKLIKGALWLP